VTLLVACRQSPEEEAPHPTNVGLRVRNAMMISKIFRFLSIGPYRSYFFSALPD
jgi:hypothetical protein